MFGLVWGPTLAAVSVVLDNASDTPAVQRALQCLQLAARMAAHHQVEQTGCGVAWVVVLVFIVVYGLAFASITYLASTDSNSYLHQQRCIWHQLLGFTPSSWLAPPSPSINRHAAGGRGG
jgi:hypothetical protein